MTVAFYFIGLYILGDGLRQFDPEFAISPNLPSMFYFTITPWPDCKDVRNEAWRLLSLQFVHGKFSSLRSSQTISLNCDCDREHDASIWECDRIARLW